MFGSVAIAAGIIWVLVVHVLAVNQSHVLVASYTYLVTGSPLVPGISHRSSPSSKALIEHPHRWIQLLWGKRKIIYEVLIPTGVVGVASSWALGADLMVFFLQSIAYPLTFLVNGFDVLAGLMVVLACSAMVITSLATSPRRFARRSALVLGVAMLAQSAGARELQAPRGLPLLPYRSRAPRPPPWTGAWQPPRLHAEVIASWGVMGRFSERSLGRAPLRGRGGRARQGASTVVFVLTNAGLENDPPEVVAAISRYVRDDLKAKVLVDSDGVEVFEWHAPPGTVPGPDPEPV